MPPALSLPANTFRARLDAAGRMPQIQGLVFLPGASRVGQPAPVGSRAPTPSPR